MPQNIIQNVNKLNALKLLPFARSKLQTESMTLYGATNQVLVTPNSIDETGVLDPGNREAFYL